MVFASYAEGMESFPDYMLADGSGRHGVMCSAKSDASKLTVDAKKEMRALKGA
ncbi:hypothetical protein [Belnapia rosea]|uniref:hypothetical protein n=1 Tax=Belnapia rosea TaxID=938405 RepID=UPI00088A4DFA|nr:hypothetical protein [Belnapia rosea]SDB45275.1 hypothetical protein SAMN02927895_01649 [Belnapia rosea]